ncbi:hypothetical protein [Peribacillus simplex]|uniref:hypothetical protein n=1 Tax=Peribacillus simplex TaxID=1478 RepID=UPI00288BC3CB|nr:hypothetical protein [Peribacillus simplex]
MQQYENILVRNDQGIMWLTLNRSELRNRLNKETYMRLNLHFDGQRKMLILKLLLFKVLVGSHLQLALILSSFVREKCSKL